MGRYRYTITWIATVSGVFGGFVLGWHLGGGP